MQPLKPVLREFVRAQPLVFEKRGQLFIRVHNETLSVVAMCVCNKDSPPVGIGSCYTAPTPTGFAQIVSDDFPILQRES